MHIMHSPEHILHSDVAICLNSRLILQLHEGRLPQPEQSEHKLDYNQDYFNVFQI